MNHRKTILALALVLAGTIAHEAALAHGRGAQVRFGFHIGVPVYVPRVYYSPAYYPGPYFYDYPRVVVTPASPPVYIERSAPQAAPEPAPTQYWYYCADAQAYYPYVKQCPGGWQRVSPQPPAQ